MLGPLAAASVVAVFLLWVVRQGPQQLTGLVPGLESLGLLTGLLSADLLLLQVFLLARIPWVERAWGHDVLVRRHGWLGFGSFALMVAHVVAFAAERLLRDDSASWSPLWSLFVTASWMLWASVGTLLVVVVTLTSVRAVRRRLRYESWRLLHLYGYLGVGLALPHQILDGSDFQSRLASRYWWSVWALAAGSVLVFRIGLPLWRSASCRLRVASVTPEVTGVVSVVVEGRALHRLRTRSGQFFVWRFLDGPGWTRGHPYTISAAPTDDRLRITVQAAGDGSGRAARLQPGTRVFIEGPYGTMTAERRRQPGLLAMAAGVGITPIHALLEDTPYAPGEAVLVYRYSSADHEIFAAEIATLAERRVSASSTCRGRAGRTAAGDRTGWMTARTTGRPCVTSCPTWPSATSSSAARRPGPAPSGGRHVPEAPRASRSTPRTSRGEPDQLLARLMRRLLVWAGVTVVLLVLLVGYQLLGASGRP